jgi:acyl-CoA synthetase (AMP-forming)/AMP-acid ligase II
MPSLVAALRRAAADRPPKELLSFGGLSLSYGAVEARAEYVAARLRAAGIVPGDRVALFLHNSPSFVEAYLGALLAGASWCRSIRYRHDERSTSSGTRRRGSSSRTRPAGRSWTGGRR